MVLANIDARPDTPNIALGAMSEKGDVGKMAFLTNGIPHERHSSRAAEFIKKT